MRYLFLCTLLICTTLTTTVSAQIAPGEAFNEVPLSLVPEYPKPNESVTASIVSYSHNLQGLSIQWLLNGDLFREGVGLTSIVFTAPPLGESLILTAQVGTVARVEQAITPTSISILWEAQTYTPKHYLGRALPTDSSMITTVALPHLGTIDTENLIYNWYKDGTSLITQSGADKSTLFTQSPGLFDDYILSVEVTDTTGSVLGTNGVRITNTTPELLFYEESPLLGTLLHNSLQKDSFLTTAPENTITVLPYYFSVMQPLELSYKWKVSNIDYLQDTQVNNLIVKQFMSGASILVEARHPNILLQSSSINFIPNTTSTLYNDDGDALYTSPFGTN